MTTISTLAEAKTSLLHTAMATALQDPDVPAAMSSRIGEDSVRLIQEFLGALYDGGLFRPELQLVCDLLFLLNFQIDRLVVSETGDSSEAAEYIVSGLAKFLASAGFELPRKVIRTISDYEDEE